MSIANPAQVCEHARSKNDLLPNLLVIAPIAEVAQMIDLQRDPPPSMLRTEHCTFYLWHNWRFSLSLSFVRDAEKNPIICKDIKNK